MESYEIVIGLEIHAELNTQTKIFCGCQNAFGHAPNTNCCPVCLGLPGSLPVTNKAAIEKTIKAGLCFGCKISPLSVFERKNYFYPDLSKAYQVSQLIAPTCVGGGILLDSGKFIRLNRIHLEEDAGKLIHHGLSVGTFVDYNRGGVPLIESVTEPDISNADEAVEFLIKLRRDLIYAGVANCKMEQGGMRCDVNLSVRKKGASLGTRTEMKNLNSFRSVKRAIEYESQRQIAELEKGNRIVQETRRWDDNKGKSFSMRSKEEAQDYRYFPDPDLLSVQTSPEDIERLRKELPALSQERMDRYINEYGIPKYDAGILISEKFFSDYYDECVALLNKPKQISNWVMTEVLKKIKEQPTEDLRDIISAKNLTTLISLVEDGKVTRTNSKELFEKVCWTNTDVNKLAKELNMLGGLADEELIAQVLLALDTNSTAISDYVTSPDKVINFFIGQVMRGTKGMAKADKVKPIIISELDKRTK